MSWKTQVIFDWSEDIWIIQTNRIEILKDGFNPLCIILQTWFEWCIIYRSDCNNLLQEMIDRKKLIDHTKVSI
jgi:hypothetical protein